MSDAILDLANDTSSFPNQPIVQTGVLTSSNYEAGFNFVSGSNYEGYVSTDIGVNAVVCAITYGSGFRILPISDTQGAYVYNYVANGQGAFTTGTYDDVTGLYYSPPTSPNYPASTVWHCPVFSSTEAALSAASLFFEYELGSDESEYQFSIPAGYVAYISLVDPTKELRIDATMPKNSAVLGSWWTNTTTIRDGASYPTAGDTFPNSGASRINWFRNVTGGTNLIGQTKSASFMYSASSNMIEIYNPYHFDGSIGDPLPNPTLYVTVTGLAENGLRLYALADEASLAQGSLGISSSSPNGYTEYWNSENSPPDPSLPPPTSPTPVINFKDQNDDPKPAPTTGGYNEPIDDESIRDILQNFFKSITGLFSEGHDAIRTLTESAQEFVSHLSELYSWLPPQVLAVLTSAIILAIIIGVLKVFL